MLTLLRIANYAIIDEIEIELGAGFSVMTGETGAGKSIMVDAIGLALGDRADATTVRSGARRAEIGLLFEEIDDRVALDWLRERDLDDDGTVHLRRVINADGRSRAFINNQPVNLQDLRALGAMLIDIHGQHQHQTLLSRATQRRVVDTHGKLTAQADEVRAAFDEWRLRAEAHARRTENAAEHEAQIDLLRFQLRELEELGPRQDEFEELSQERERLGHIDALLTGLDGLRDQLYDDEQAAQSQLARSTQTLNRLAALDRNLEPLAERVSGIEIELRDIASELGHYRASLDTDPSRLEEVENRLDAFARLARRHKVNATDLHTIPAEVQAALADLDDNGITLDDLAARAETARARCFERAAALSAARRSSASTLSAEVSAELRKLGMPAGEFRVHFSVRPDDQVDSNGLDDIEFQVQLNPGQKFGSLSRTASGGELSRISLALEVVTRGTSRVATFIFDEVDAGIGGGTAEIVGRRLRQIASNRQVLCVTHLAQVASCGQQHYRITKLTDGRVSRTLVRQLNDDERVEELSRMLGGLEITDTTRAHAAELIQNAAE